MDQLTYKKGLLAELKKQRRTLEIEIDSAVKSLIYHFDPLDQDFGYISTIDPEKIDVYTGIIKRKKKAIDKMNGRIQQLASETGENE